MNEGRSEGQAPMPGDRIREILGRVAAHELSIEEALAQIREETGEGVPRGWQPMPIEPTDKMLWALARSAIDYLEDREGIKARYAELLEMGQRLRAKVVWLGGKIGGGGTHAGF